MFRLCLECNNWAQWKVAETPETEERKFLCTIHAEEFRKQHPKSAGWFCGAVPLK